MKKLFLFLSLPILCLAEVDPETGFDDGILLASDEEQFALIKANIAQQLEYASTNITDAIHEIDELQYTINRDVQFYNEVYQHTPTDYNQGRADAAQDIQQEVDSYCLLARNNLNESVRNVNSALNWLNRINYAGSSGSYSNVLEFIATNQYHIAHNTRDTTNLLFTVVSNLCVMSELLEDVCPDLYDFLETILPDLNECWMNMVSFFEWAADEEGFFRLFFNFAYERLEFPDVSLQAALVAAWDDSVLHFNKILQGPKSNNYYRTMSPLFGLRTALNQELTHLSNEGWILAESLQAQTWSYFLLTEINSKIGNNQTNYIDAPWLLDILDEVKKNNNYWHEHALYARPYFEEFHNTFSPGPPSLEPYYVNYYRKFTNWIVKAQSGDPLGQILLARSQYRSTYTNWFDRIEHLLMLSNGLIPLGDAFDSREFTENNLDVENNERRIRYATNSIYELVATLSASSNKLTTCVGKFKDFINAFSLPEGHGDGYLLMIPELELGPMSIEVPTISWSDLEVYTDPIRIVCQLLWYTIFGLVSFRLVLLVIYLFGRTVTHTILIVSTLMS